MFGKKWNKQIRLYYWLLLAVFILSCSGTSPDETSEKLSDLVVEVQIVGATQENPNGDGSGMINLSFSAKNATSYKIKFGNGETCETSSKSIFYTYVGEGTKTYQIFVSAYNAEKFISSSETVSIYVEPSRIFSEEFNVDGAPDSSKWVYDMGAGGWGNNEHQFYTSRAENAVVENGVLKINVKRDNYEGASFTSARLKTQGKFSFTYGKVEVRAKLPAGGGTWPAIWMLGSNITEVGWPASGEIDIMEHVGNIPGRILSAIHTPSSHGNTNNKGTTMVPDATSEFHVYGAEWDAQKIEFSVDGEVFYTYNPAVKNSSTWPFDSDQFIILNIAVGGSLGGNIDPDFTSGTMEIDYVRVTQ